MAFGKYILVNDDGEIVSSKISKRSPGPQWRRLNTDEINLLNYGASRVIIRGKKMTGPMRHRTFIKIEPGDSRFPADGETVMSINVRGEDLGDNTRVKLTVNGHPYTATKKKHLEIVTDTPGLYNVKLADKRFWAHKPNQTIVAYDPQEQSSE